MQTKKRLISLVRTGARLVILAAILMTALISNVAPAAALPRVGSVTVGSQSGSLTEGAAGSATYLVTVERATSQTLNVDLSATGLPAGATASFSPSSLDWSAGGTSRTSTLTVNTTTATPGGSTNFTVRAVRTNGGGGNDDATGSGTLAILIPQTITFGTLANKTFGDADFNVSATGGGSGNPVTFTASGYCTVAGTLVHITSVGSCTIVAKQAGNSSYAAAEPVAQSFTIESDHPTVVVNLCATTGSMTLPAGSIPIWGYVSGDCSGSPAATLPGGPPINVNQYDQITVNLHNNLPALTSTAILFQGQDIVPDIAGVASGGMKSYTFYASRPGTYLYEAGLLPGAQYQPAMGLYGALIIQPAAAGQAYDNANTAYDDEAVLVLSEIDPALNGSGDPAAFDMRNYAPKYFLINGQVYPDTTDIPTAAGSRVLLRYLNAGAQFHSMALLGMHQTVIANDGSPLAHPYDMVGETFGPGQTADTIATIPAEAAAGSQFAIYDGNLMQYNSGSAGFGGMMTFLTVSGTTPPGDTTGPVTSDVNYTAGTLTATVDDTSTGNSNIAAAEYFMDSVGTAGSGTGMTGAFASPTETVSAVVVVPAGPHTLYVRGKDAAGNWGTVSSLLVNGGDATGPATTGLTLTPSHTNGTVDVAVHATGDDSASGGSNIVAAEYTIDGGPAVPMNVNVQAPIASLDQTIAEADVNGLLEGSHVVAVRSQDAADNWGAPATIDLIVDKTGPDTSNVTASPNPNSGLVGFPGSVPPAVRVTAYLEDTASNVRAAEGFIDSIGADGTGIIFVASDGSFNSQSENSFADIPLTTIIQLSEGDHTLYVHGKDAAGNWGATSSTILAIDKTPPVVTSINRLDPSPIAAAAVQFTVTFSEDVTGVTAANFGLVEGGGLNGAAITSVTGSGMSRTVTASTGSGGGTLGLNLTSAAGIKDVAGNPLPSTGLPFVGQVYILLTPPLYFSTAGNTNPPGVGGSADDADIYFWDGAAFNRAIDASGLNLPGGANVDGFDRVDATHFYMSFTNGVTVPGIGGTVQDEDVVYYNNGTWSLFFDGSANSIGGTDLDAISIVGGTLYFSTDDNDSISGGSGDDADIYRWNGGSSYTRMIDASAVGWSTSNVDGLVWVDANHVYLSYSGTNTNVPGFGSVQDEDVVAYNSGTWSVYFDGTGKGLDTSGNLDVDAFDLP